MVLNIFTNFCDMWWLAWLLPFLLGLLLGWLLWARYRSMYNDSQDENARLQARIKELEEALANCKAARASLDGEIATLKGRIREMEANLEANASVAAAAPVAPEVSAIAATAAPERKATVKFAALKEDNLQVVEGIGPKMESVLKDNGVHTWSELADNTPESLRAILAKYGDKYRIIDPNTWADQAKLARDGKWDELIHMQKNLDTGRSDKSTGLTDSKVEKIMIKLGLLKRWKENDLKAVEGIGPKIEKLLQADGIMTWRALADSSVERIQGILDAAGKRYQLADPGTWPQQAGLAADGKWDELEALQDQLNGGK